jgi:hypothetical protein
VQAATNGNLHIRDISAVVGSGTGVALDVLNDAANTVNDIAIRGATTIFRNAAGETARLDSSGNLGIGVAPSTFSVGKALEIGFAGNTLFGATSGQLNLMQNASYNAAFKYVYTAAASYYQQLSGSHIWYNAPSGTAGNTITFTQAMTLDASGRLGLGTSSPSGWTSASPALAVVNSNTTAYSATTFNGSPNLILGAGNASGAYNSIRFTAASSNELSFGVVQESGGAGAFVFQGYSGSAYSERMRLDSSGRVGIGTTSPGSVFHARLPGTSTSTIATFDRSDGAVSSEIHYDGTDGRITFGTTTNHPLSFKTNNTRAVTIDSSQRVGIGTTGPAAILHTSSTGDGYKYIADDTTNNRTFGFFSDSTIGKLIAVNNARNAWTSLGIDGADVRLFITGTEKARIDSSGRLLVGTSSTVINTDQLQVVADNSSCIGVVSGRNDIYGPRIDLVKSRGSTASPVIVNNNDQLGVIWFGGYTTSYQNSATIEAYADGTYAVNNVPGRLVFSTTPSGSASPTEAMRINNQRELLIGTITRTSNGGVLQVSNGITFPATQSACTDPNTLDDYEEGTWTPTQGTGVTAVGAFSSTGSYVKIGKQVSFAGYITAVTSVAFNPASGTLVAGGLPFSVLSGIGSGTGCNASVTVVISVVPSGTGIYGGASIAATTVIYFAGTYPI